jgi:3-oxoacyl-[acyl-carrier protein] reductase
MVPEDPRGRARLDGRVAIITGGAHGMGREHCLELAARGARVAVGDIDLAAAEETAATVRASGGEAIAVACDVGLEADVQELVRATVAEFGGIDVLVSNAGILSGRKKLADTALEDFRRQLQVNLDGAFLLSREALEHLRRSPAGRIILVSSQWGQVGPGFAYGYVTAKSGLIGLAKNLAIELAPDGILVNAIAPGTIRTRMLEEAGINLERTIPTIPVGRIAEPREVSYLVAFLASEESGFITGVTLPINGGAEIGGF